MKEIDEEVFTEALPDVQPPGPAIDDKNGRFTVTSRRHGELGPDIATATTAYADVRISRLALMQHLRLSVFQSVLDGSAVFVESITTALGNLTQLLAAVAKFGRDFCTYVRNFPTYFETKILMVPEPVYHEF